MNVEWAELIDFLFFPRRVRFVYRQIANDSIDVLSAIKFRHADLMESDAVCTLLAVLYDVIACDVSNYPRK